MVIEIFRVVPEQGAGDPEQAHRPGLGPVGRQAHATGAVPG